MVIFYVFKKQLYLILPLVWIIFPQMVEQTNKMQDGLPLVCEFIFFNNKVLLQWGINVILSNPTKVNFPTAFTTYIVSCSNDVGSAIINTASGCTKTQIYLYGETVGSNTNTIKFSWIAVGF